VSERELSEDIRAAEGALGIPLTAWKAKMVASARD
jgi:hypothetical protein